MPWTYGGVTYNDYIVTIGSSWPGVAITDATVPPTSSPSWFINSQSSSTGLQQEILRIVTQVSQMFGFVCQDNPSGPYTFTIALVDSAGTPVQQTGMISVQVWDSALQRNKKTLLTIDASSAASSGTSGNIQQRLPYNFGAPGAYYVTTPGDVIRVYFTPNAAQNGVSSKNSIVQLYTSLLSQ
jgi:hypothetical protein